VSKPPAPKRPPRKRAPRGARGPRDPAAKLVAAIRKGIPAGVELDEREEALLDLAGRQACDVAAAEADVKARGYLVEGSRGQPVVNPSIGEARQARLALAKLLAQLELPDLSGVLRDQSSRDAQKAAQRRWGTG
jgi:hypothetical protein